MVEFLIDGHLDEGRELLQDRNATQDEIISEFRSARGLKFVSDCGLRKVDDPGGQEHNQVLDAVRSEETIRQDASQWFTSLKSELAQHSKLSKQQWVTAIQQTVPNRLNSLTSDIDREIDRQ